MSKRALEENSVVGFPVLDDIIVYIVSFLCVRPKDERMKEFHIKMITLEVSDQRLVCRAFRDAIDAGLTLWQRVLSFTRRSLVEPPPLMPKSVIDIKEFVRLDMEEFHLRMKMAMMAETSRHGRMISSDNAYKMFDYTKAGFGEYRFRLPASAYTELLETVYRSMSEKYDRMIKRMNNLCGITQ